MRVGRLGGWGLELFFVALKREGGGVGRGMLWVLAVSGFLGRFLGFLCLCFLRFFYFFLRGVDEGFGG